MAKRSFNQRIADEIKEIDESPGGLIALMDNPLDACFISKETHPILFGVIVRHALDQQLIFEENDLERFCASEEEINALRKEINSMSSQAWCGGMLPQGVKIFQVEFH